MENKGQWEEVVKFKAEIPSGALFLEKTCFTYNLYDSRALQEMFPHPGTVQSLAAPRQNDKLKYHAFKMHFLNANPAVHVKGKDALIEYHNYFIGNDPSRWASRAAVFNQIEYDELYPGIDLKLYTSQGSLKYDLIAEPGSDPSQIGFLYEGLNGIRLKNGNLVLQTVFGEIIEKKPYAWQYIQGEIREVPCRFVLNGNKVTFRFPSGYDQRYQLIIDPVLMFSTYSGSFSDNFGYTATFDSHGFLYSGSTAFGTLYPTTPGAYDQTYNGNVDIAITKYDTTGTSRIYSTYLGGDRAEMPHSMIVNKKDELFVFGTTGSSNYPTTATAYDQTFGGGTSVTPQGLGVTFPSGTDIIVSRFSQDGSALLASTYIGGSGNDGLNTSNTRLKYNYADEARGEIEIDKDDNIYIATCTYSSDFPISTKAFQKTPGGGLDGCIVKMNNDLTSILWSSYLGGKQDDAIYSLAIDSKGDIYVVGGTASDSFPLSENILFDKYQGGRCDGFITHIDEHGGEIINSTYFGSSFYDQLFFIEVDRSDNVYIFGQTEATGSTFIHNAGYSRPNSGQVLSKITPKLDSLIWSTVFGSGQAGTVRPNISPTAFMVDLCNKVYLSGWGGTLGGFNPNNRGTGGMDVTADAYRSVTTGRDFYLMVLEDDASALVYGSYFGGTQSDNHVDGGTSRFDRKGKIYQAVCASCGWFQDFPIHPNPGAVSTTNNNRCNSAVFKFDFNLPIVVADFIAPPAGCAPFTVEFNNTSLIRSATTFLWDFGDGNTSTAANPVHTYNSPGLYRVSLSISDVATCNLADSLTKEILVLGDTIYTLAPETICRGDAVRIGIAGEKDEGYVYSWIPQIGLDDPHAPDPLATPFGTTNYILTVSNGICTDTIFQTVNVSFALAEAGNDTIICRDSPAVITAESYGTGQTYIWSAFPSFKDTLNTDLSDPVLVIDPAAGGTYHLRIYNSHGCFADDSIHVSIKNILLGKPDFVLLCFGDTTWLSVNNLNPVDTLTYQWEPALMIIGPNDSSAVRVSPAMNTTYTVTVTDQLDCTQEEIIQVRLAGDTIYTLPSQLVCREDSIRIGIPSNPFHSYAWTPADGLGNTEISDPMASPFSGTGYMLVVSRGTCRDTIYQRLDVSFVTIDAGNDIVLCRNEAAPVLTAQSSGNTFIWSSSASFTDTLNANLSYGSITVDPFLPENTYYVKSFNQDGCSAADSVKIFVKDLRLIPEQEKFICYGDTVFISVSTTSPQDTLTYQWYPEDYIIGRSDTSMILTNPLQTTTYVVRANDSFTCMHYDSVKVNVSPLHQAILAAWPEKDTIYAGHSTILHVYPESGFSYHWQPEESLNNAFISSPSASPLVTTTYTLSVSDMNGACVYDTTVTVHVIAVLCGEPDVFIPNAFTPNGDGNNDMLFVRGKYLEKLFFTIYNRWGERVFETKDKNQGWDGKYKGRDADPGVFVYYLEGTCVDGQEIFMKGNITLIR